MRGLDREVNLQIYPKLFYPEIYVLQGGYSEFWRSFPQWCQGGYVKMTDGESQSQNSIPNSTHLLFTGNKKTLQKAVQNKKQFITKRVWIQTNSGTEN